MSAAVAMIPYANMAPYRQLGPPAGCRLVPLVPRASVAALLRGAVVAAAVPVGGLPRLTGIVEPLGRFGIAAQGPSMSVLLFSRYPFDHLHVPRTLRLTDESASSVRLLYLLLGDTVGFDRLPSMAGRGASADAELLIGDRALVRGASGRRDDTMPHVIDLAQVWYERHGLPFVFARWVVRKDAGPTIKRVLSEWLAQFKADEARLVDRAVPDAAAVLGVSEELIHCYFQVIRRCLDDSDLLGQRRFIEQMARFGRTPLFPDATMNPPEDSPVHDGTIRI